MRIETVRFQRTQDSDFEDGIMINEGDGPLIDRDGKLVPSEPQIWSWRETNRQVITVFEDER